MRKPFIAGNWKMYKSRAEAVKFAEDFGNAEIREGVRVAICAPYLFIGSLKDVLADTKSGFRIEVGAQNVHFADEGAYTGEISAGMLEEAGADVCIIGHSERRQYFAEDDKSVNLKLKKLLSTKISPIVCVGEVLSERDEGVAEKVVETQVRAAFSEIEGSRVPEVTIAYEPVWAIGTGRTASPEQAQEMCAFIRKILADMYGEDIAQRVVIQYGGSVKPGNIAELMAMEDIDGALVGGASLVAEEFIKIVNQGGM